MLRSMRGIVALGGLCLAVATGCGGDMVKQVMANPESSGIRRFPGFPTQSWWAGFWMLVSPPGPVPAAIPMQTTSVKLPVANPGQPAK